MKGKKEYYRRVADDYFALKLRSAGALHIIGPKWCGKTRSAEEMCKSALYCEDPDERKNITFQAKEKVSALLEGDTPRLIDEWQIVPEIWDSVRFTVDKRSLPGQFILTGSVVPNISEEEERKRHSGTGRIATVQMRPMSLYESRDSDGSVSLRELFAGKRPHCSKSKMTLERLAFLICRGGWPSFINTDDDASLEIPKNCVETIVNEDCRRVDGVKRDNILMRNVLKSYSRLSTTKSDISTIQSDIGGNSVATTKTIGSYLNALKKLYVIDDVPSWAPSMMSKARMRTTPKRCLVDPSLATASLGMAPEALLKDHSIFGILFETLVDRDLKVYSQPLDGQVFHYHDNTGLEVDAIIELANGDWGAVEIKLDPSMEDEAARTLHLMRRKIRKEPTFMMVLVGIGTTHVRDDGIIVVPIGSLRD